MHTTLVDLQKLLSTFEKEFLNEMNSSAEYDVEDTGHEADKGGYSEKTSVVSRQEP